MGCLIGQLLGPQIERPHALGQLVFGRNCGLQFLGQLLDVEFLLFAGLAFQGQKVGQFGDLVPQPVKRLVTPGKGQAQKKLGDHEKHQKEHDDHQKRSQPVDESGPYIYAVLRASRARRHGS